MKATQELHDLGQSLWLDNITRDLLDDGTLKRYIDEFSITGLTSNLASSRCRSTSHRCCRPSWFRQCPGHGRLSRR